MGWTVTWGLLYQLSAPKDIFCAIADEMALSAVKLRMAVFIIKAAVCDVCWKRK